MGRKFIGILLFSIWLAGIGFGLKFLFDYSARAGTIGEVRDHWPRASRLPRARDGATLVLFLHPKCACSVATLDELGVLLARVDRPVLLEALFAKPEGWSDDDVRATSLWRQASAIPGVRVTIDERGEEAGLFGSETSGHVFVYDEQGRLAYSGGLTPSRGHEGESFGLASAVEAVELGGATARNGHVFGCALASHAMQAGRESHAETR